MAGGGGKSNFITVILTSPAKYLNHWGKGNLKQKLLITHSIFSFINIVFSYYTNNIPPDWKLKG
jgi:hypothetical protein